MPFPPSTNKKSKPAPLWDSVKELYRDFDLQSFRAIGGVNDRLGVWGAKHNSSRYYKSLMFEFSMYLNNLLFNKGIDDVRDITATLNKIKNQNLGSPPTIRLDETDVSLDYLWGLEEYIFCLDTLSEVDSICEIGAGFGRTCHTFLSLTDIASYTIVDLPEILALSKAYLSEVLDKKEYEKIRFVSADDYASVQEFDLAININSLQEMPNLVGRAYLEFISMRSQFFFTKNALGKYSPSDIDLEITNTNEYESAMEMGLITDKFKLFDINRREEAVKIYHEIYCPNGFTLLKTQRGFGQHLSYELSLFHKYSGRQI